MELVAIVVAAALGWSRGTLGSHELKAIAIVVLGWTAVTTVASLPHIAIADVLFVLAFRTLLVGGPYAIAALAKGWRTRRR